MAPITNAQSHCVIKSPKVLKQTRNIRNTARVNIRKPPKVTFSAAMDVGTRSLTRPLYVLRFNSSLRILRFVFRLFQFLYSSRFVVYSVPQVWKVNNNAGKAIAIPWTKILLNELFFWDCLTLSRPQKTTAYTRSFSTYLPITSERLREPSQRISGTSILRFSMMRSLCSIKSCIIIFISALTSCDGS